MSYYCIKMLLFMIGLICINELIENRLIILQTGNKGRPGRKKGGSEKKKVDSGGVDPRLNAVSYLNELMKARNEKQPEYTLKSDAGPTQKGLMRFQIEVCVHNSECFYCFFFS